MKKILHITDTHLGEAGRSHAHLESLSAVFEALQGRSDYVIVHTGDVMDDATDRDLQRAAHNWLLGNEQLPNSTIPVPRVSVPKVPVLLVPGNHDLGHGVLNRDSWRREFYRLYPQLQVSPPSRAASPDDRPTPVLSFRSPWIEDDLVVIGLDTLDVEGSDFRCQLGKPQRDWLAEQLSNTRKHSVRVIAMHYPPLGGKSMFGRIPLRLPALADAVELREVISRGGGISLLLCGHTHYEMHPLTGWDVRHYRNGVPTGSMAVDGKTRPYCLYDLSGPDLVEEAFL